MLIIPYFEGTSGFSSILTLAIVTLPEYSSAISANIGEICLQGKVTAIGGLDLKILGGLNAGVKTFIYPKENNKDYKIFMDKYKDTQNLDDISFIEVQHISEVLKIVFV